MLQRIGSALIIFTGFLIAMMVAIPGFTPGQLVSALGIGSVAIGFAFKDIFQNLLSGILLLLNEPFKIGERIVNGSFEGTVETIEIPSPTEHSPDRIIALYRLDGKYTAQALAMNGGAA
mgnify:FL=1